MLNLTVLPIVLESYKHQAVFVITKRGFSVGFNFSFLFLIQEGVLKIFF